MILRDSAPHGPHLLLGLSAQRGSRIGLGPFGRCRPAVAHSLPILRSMLRGIVEHCDVEQRRAHERVTEHRPERRLVEARVAGLPPHGGPGVNIFAIGRCAHGTRISRLPRPSPPPLLRGSLGAPARPFAEIGLLPQQDRSYSAPRPVRGARRAPAPPQSESPRSSQHHAPLRQHRRTATSRRFSPRAAAPAAVKAYGWSSRPGAASLEDPSGSRQSLIGRYRAGSSSARSVGPHARARAPRPRRTPRGGTPLGITDPHERPRTDDERRVQRQRAFVA